MLYILSVYGTSVALFLAYRNSKRMMKNTASKAPPDAPSIIAIWLCLVRFLLVTIVTCGVSIEGFDETSLHVIVEKERHKFPDVLRKLSWCIRMLKYDGWTTLFSVSYLTSKLSLFRESGRLPSSLLFSTFLKKSEEGFFSQWDTHIVYMK